MTGSFRYGPGDYQTSIDLVATGKIDVGKIVTHRVSLSSTLRLASATAHIRSSLTLAVHVRGHAQGLRRHGQGRRRGRQGYHQGTGLPGSRSVKRFAARSLAARSRRAFEMRC